MHCEFEHDDHFDPANRCQRVELVADRFVDEQFIAALVRAAQSGRGTLIVRDGDGYEAAASFKAAKLRKSP